jgi:hypothetical protein
MHAFARNTRYLNQNFLKTSFCQKEAHTKAALVEKTMQCSNTISTVSPSSEMAEVPKVHSKFNLLLSKWKEGY